MEKINISDIIIDREYQTRSYGVAKKECELHIGDIAQSVASGKAIPPIEVQRLPDGRMFLTDGFHRTEAHIQAGANTIDAIIQDVASEEDVWAAGFGANARAAQEQQWGRKPTAEERRASLALYLERPDALVKFGHAERHEVAGHTWYTLDKKSICKQLGLSPKDFSSDGPHRPLLDQWESQLSHAALKRHKEGKAILAISKEVGVSRDKVKRIIEIEENDQLLAQISGSYTTPDHPEELEVLGVSTFWRTLRDLKDGNVNLASELLHTLDKNGEHAQLIDWLLDGLDSMERSADKVPEDRLGILMERWDC